MIKCSVRPPELLSLKKIWVRQRGFYVSLLISLAPSRFVSRRQPKIQIYSSILLVILAWTIWNEFTLGIVLGLSKNRKLYFLSVLVKSKKRVHVNSNDINTRSTAQPVPPASLAGELFSIVCISARQAQLACSCSIHMV